ncbi:MAG: adenosine kinase [Proteobacteria bacterium]|nr:adenosine kinase [Pseudomonadota bacterium]
MTAAAYDVAAIGNAIVDVIAPASDDFLAMQDLRKNAMTLIDEARAASIYEAMAAGVETSGGSAGNTVAGVCSLGGKAAYIGKVAADQLGQVFGHDVRAIGAHFDTPPLSGGPTTARCLINVTPDGHRTMATYLGAATSLTPEDVDPVVIEGALITYLEGYLFDAPLAREAFVKAAALARAAGRKVSMTLSDVFVVERWRAELIGFMDHIDVVFANENELKSLFETDDFDLAADRLASMVEIAALTRSEHGSVVRRGAEAHIIPAFPIDKVLDTTGAGDQYAAGFLYGLSHGRPLDVCGALGALSAWEVIGHYGPRPQASLKDLAAERGLL